MAEDLTDFHTGVANERSSTRALRARLTRERVRRSTGLRCWKISRRTSKGISTANLRLPLFPRTLAQSAGGLPSASPAPGPFLTVFVMLRGVLLLAKVWARVNDSKELGEVVGASMFQAYVGTSHET